MKLINTIFSKWIMPRLVVLSIFVFMGSSGFMSPVDEDCYDILTTLQSDFFDDYVNQFYQDLDGSKTELSVDVLKMGLRGYYVLRESGQLNNDQFLTLIDFSKHSNDKRMWIIDVFDKKIVLNDRIAHGKMSGDDYATQFSNNQKSRMSSLGFYLTGNPYNGSNGLSLKLHGLEKNFNDNAFARGVVIHGANYMEEKFIAYNNDKPGRSFGCPAVNEELNKYMVATLKDESCLFIYHPTEGYLNRSQLVNASLYVPIDRFL